ncbi:high frequency lysogenization protein HflD [Thiorhodococcus minor]|uniref:High frequency lysogenization protein HflD homolog n=1 Tax=Thiorhodococcus minor TaxID=57489 RepID=A0A6M0K267_9GAMM|nr:high frequency lysogenization protein HflD [Thiorhodococcus minor]NEV62667.1 high frequency lysogenization protein HflD [Thiorhodococcus minor]
MAHDNQDRIIALAGIYQAINCVVRIAHRGTADTEAMEPCIYSLFQVDAESVGAVYGEPGAVVNGARQIVAQLLGQPERNLELTRYVVQVMKLERSLARRPDVLARIAQGIEEAGTKQEHFALLHPSLIAHFADLYSNTLSQLSPRIIVRGDQLHLRNPDNQSRLRAMLLAAVRSAMLWRQVGGTRLQLLFKNRQILEDARHYIDANAD